MRRHCIAVSGSFQCFLHFFHDLARSIVIFFYVLPVCLVNDGNENGGQDFEWISDKYDP